MNVSHMKVNLINTIAIMLLTLLILLAMPTAMAGEPRKEFLSDFVLGQYLLVGKGADSTDTYFGHVEIYSEEGVLRVRRKIGSETVLGIARIENSDDSGTKVLRVMFDIDGQPYKNTCLVHGDLDNYARISCHLYLSEGGTKHPGLEVLFVDHAESSN